MLRVSQLQGFNVGGSFIVKNSCDFEDADSDGLQIASWPTPTDREKWTWAGWLKRESAAEANFVMHVGVSFPTDESEILLTSTGYFALVGFQSSAYTVRVSAFSNAGTLAEWHHWMCVYDSAQGTASNRVKLYRDGVLATSGFEFSTYPTTSGQMHINSAAANHTYARDQVGARVENYDGLMAEVHFIDGQALEPGRFIRQSGADVLPIRYTGTHGNAGSYLEFLSSGALGTDTSGNGNDWTVNNTPTQSSDVPP